VSLARLRYFFAGAAGAGDAEDGSAGGAGAGAASEFHVSRRIGHFPPVLV